jgi:hypothetical protein
MNHGQFYKADQLVAAVHQDAGGIFPGFRAAHAVGRIYAGTFTPTAAAKTLSRAAHFQDAPVPATARFSGTSGDPSQKPSNVAAMALKFYLPDGTITDLIGITLPAFFAVLSQKTKNGIFVCGKCLIFQNHIWRSHRKNEFLQQNRFRWLTGAGLL